MDPSVRYPVYSIATMSPFAGLAFSFDSCKMAYFAPLGVVKISGAARAGVTGAKVATTGRSKAGARADVVVNNSDLRSDKRGVLVVAADPDLVRPGVDSAEQCSALYRMDNTAATDNESLIAHIVIMPGEYDRFEDHLIRSYYYSRPVVTRGFSPQSRAQTTRWP
jgi:hypothetical protein